MSSYIKNIKNTLFFAITVLGSLFICDIACAADEKYFPVIQAMGTLANGEPIFTDLNVNSLKQTVGDLKKMLAEKTGYSVENIYLLKFAKVMMGMTFVDSYDLQTASDRETLSALGYKKLSWTELASYKILWKYIPIQEQQQQPTY